MNDHEPQDVVKHFGTDWVNDNWRKGISRNLEHAQDRYHLQKWERFMSCMWKRQTLEDPAGMKQNSFTLEDPSEMINNA